VTATDRPTAGIGFNGHRPAVAAQIAVSNPAPDRSVETGHLATDQNARAQGWSEPASSPRSAPFEPQIKTIRFENPTRTPKPKNGA
jgi:hypothetical protein